MRSSMRETGSTQPVRLSDKQEVVIWLTGAVQWYRTRDVNFEDELELLK